MKKFIMTVAAAIALSATFSVVSGCKSSELPDKEKVSAYSKGAGFVSAIVVKITKADTNVVNGVCQVIDEVRSYIPEKDQTFTELWPPKVAVIVQNLVDKGKIDAKNQEAINQAFVYVCKALDKLKSKYPVWFEYEDLAKAAIDGFIEGFYTVMKYNGATQADADKAELSVNEAEVKELCTACGVPYKSMSARRR